MASTANKQSKHFPSKSTTKPFMMYAVQSWVGGQQHNARCTRTLGSSGVISSRALVCLV